MKPHSRLCLMVLAAMASTLRAEVLPSKDAPVFLHLVREGKPVAAIVVSDRATPLERIAAEKLQTWAKEACASDLEVLRASEERGEMKNVILLGTPATQPLIAECVARSHGGAGDTPFLSDEGFGIETLEKDGTRYLIVAGRTDKGVFHGAVYVRDFLLDITRPDTEAVVREVKLVRSPAIPVRGPYLLPQYGATPLMTLDHWKHVIDRMAEGGINQIHWWVAGMYPSKKYPETFEITNTKMSVDDIRALCRFAQERGMTFLVGGGGFFWHGIQKVAETHPELKAVKNGGLCPTQPESQRIMTEYALEWLETVPEADGLWIEPRDEGGLCECELCMKPLDQFKSRQYGQSEIAFLKTLMKRTWAARPKARLVWLIEYHSGIPTMPHFDDPLYFERIREIKDPRIEWMVVWEQFKLPGPRNENVPVPFFTRNAQHWDKPYWPNLQNVFAHAKMAAEQGYLGYSNAWEIGFASNDWYIDAVPYPVDIIPEVITSLGFREACWEPAQTWEEFTDRVHRRFFSREVPREIAEDMLYLRQYITTANHTMDHASPAAFNRSKPLSGEVERVASVSDETSRSAEVKRLRALLNTLRMTRDEALPGMKAIEAKIAALEPKASRKSMAAFALMRRAIDDSRRVYRDAVSDDRFIEQALAKLPDTDAK